MAGVAARRTACREGEAAVRREATGRGTAEARRGTGPRPSPQREESTSGRASSQPGHAATGPDARTKPQRRGRERGAVWRLRPSERAGPGHAGLGRGAAPLGGVTPQGGAGALGTVRARRVTPDETVGAMARVNGAEGERPREPGACGVSGRV